MPKLKQGEGVKVVLTKNEGIVGDPVTLTSSGLPKETDIELIWNTMKGSRVSGKGFGEETTLLEKIKTDENGELKYDFTVPDDLGGIPHRLDLAAGGKVYGQAYLRVLPSIVEFSPKSGPVGTKISITIKGGGWTEFDNAYYLTYDNAYTGYLCAFNSQGNLTFDVIATGDTGYHLIDLYPGSAMPAIRLAFEIIK